MFTYKSFFQVLEARHFCVLVNTLQLCSMTQLNYLEKWISLGFDLNIYLTELDQHLAYN
jgi:hypothetical protein